jgi:hypothetical protein
MIQMQEEHFWREVERLVRVLIRKILGESGFYNLYDDGKIESLSSDGKRANVFINGSTDITPNIPIREGVNLTVGDEIRVLNVNFNKRDRIIDHKKIL